MLLVVGVFLCLFGSISALSFPKLSKKPTLSLDDLQLTDKEALKKIDLSNITAPKKLGKIEFSGWQDLGLLDKIMYVDVNLLLTAYRKIKKYN